MKWARLTCLALALVATACPAQPIPLSLAQAVILRGDQPEDDLNLRAYGELFDAVALGWKIVSLREPQEPPLRDEPAPTTLILVVPARTARSLPSSQIDWVLRQVERGAILVTEEITPLSEKLGFRAGPVRRVMRLKETAYPKVNITWERPARVVSLRLPASARALTVQKRNRSPVAALLPYGSGHCLLLAAELDPVQGLGYGRFPYFVQALVAAGVTLPFRSDRLSALFDYGYRYADDPARLAETWRRVGIQALHVSAWHFWEPDTESDEYLHRLIDACHRHGILVNAWLEFPHVSQVFWKKHPAWREKTARGKDALGGWRSLMNLKDPNCFRAVAEGLRSLLHRFDWDGADLSELYVESPYGTDQPWLATPFNDLVRTEFRARYQVDPRDFFRKNSPHYWKEDPESWARFLDYRVDLVSGLTERLLGLLFEIRSTQPHLAIYLTYLDNIYEPKMREKVGVDVTKVLPLLDRYAFFLTLEDPSVLWPLGPRRYSELARRYGQLTTKTDSLGVDINFVDRRAELSWKVPVFPTDQQTGGEFLELLHHAGSNFPKVQVYSEWTIWRQDLELAPHALAVGVAGEVSGDGVIVKSARPVVFRTKAGTAEFEVDGERWPCVSAGDVLLPAGRHSVTAWPASGTARPRLVKLNGELLEAHYEGLQRIRFSYAARTRAMALFDRAPKTLEVDGLPWTGSWSDFVLLPQGSHLVQAGFE